MKPGKEIVEDKGEENIHSQGYTEVREGKDRESYSSQVPVTLARGLQRSTGS